MTNYWIQLFINRNSTTSVGAEENLNAILKKYFPGDYQLEIIDIQEHPDKAEEACILAIPTLIRKWPQPEVRLIGALTVQTRVLAGLGIANVDHLLKQKEN
ncbi:circadian clock protein KaiB [Rufibacter immobilis]|uniref:Circadian clock protein KaiB n=1 Tax=Rufibacter immobilis TaxID=1348778 RepID=A0A3M9MX04_9BACT|nr:circadian clock KaiB family protein [Rufibacter immobilis]RNI29685.1 circadian clock protein KaiB [Rufibacter immobilis]